MLALYILVCILALICACVYLYEAFKSRKSPTKCSIWSCMSAFCFLLLIRTAIRVDEITGLPTLSSNKIKNLKPFYLICRQKDVDNRAFHMLNYKYPEYAGYIKISQNQLRR